MLFTVTVRLTSRIERRPESRGELWAALSAESWGALKAALKEAFDGGSR